MVAVPINDDLIPISAEIRNEVYLKLRNFGNATGIKHRLIVERALEFYFAHVKAEFVTKPPTRTDTRGAGDFTVEQI